MYRPRRDLRVFGEREHCFQILDLHLGADEQPVAGSEFQGPEVLDLRRFDGLVDVQVRAEVVVAEEDARREAGRDASQRRGFAGEPVVGHLAAETRKAVTQDEAHAGVVVRAGPRRRGGIVEALLPPPLPVHPQQSRLEQIEFIVFDDLVLERLRPLHGQILIAGDAEDAVEAGSKVVAAIGTETAGDDAAGVGVLVEDITPKPEHAEVFRRLVLEPGRLHVDQPDVPASEATHEAGAAVDTDLVAVVVEPDAAAVKQPAESSGVESENPGALLEKLTFFGKEKRKARQVDLLVVGLDLGKVGVERGVECEVARQVVFDVEADFAGAVVLLGEGRLGVVEVRGSFDAAEQVGRHVQGFLAADAFEHHVLRLRRLAEGQAPVGRNGRVDVPLIFTRDEAIDNHPHHDLTVGILKAKAGERDAHLGKPALVGLHRGDVPEGIPTVVDDAAERAAAAEFGVVRDGEVEADAVGVGKKPEGVFVVVERVEEDREDVVAAVAVAVERVAAYARRVGVVEPPGDVDVVIVVGHPDLGALGGRALIDRFEHRHRQRGDGVPGRFVARPVEHDSRVEARQDDGCFPARLVFGRRRLRAFLRLSRQRRREQHAEKGEVKGKGDTNRRRLTK